MIVSDAPRAARAQRSLIGGRQHDEFTLGSQALSPDPFHCGTAGTGAVAKRKDSSDHLAKRSSELVKMKLERQQEFVIGGYRLTGSAGLGALLVGYYAGSKLLFAGQVRAGLIPHVRRRLLEKLKPLRLSECPFANLPDSGLHRGSDITADQMPEMQWTKPQLVAQIRFTRWTADNRLDDAAFLGLRLDKAATKVRRGP